MVGINSSGRQPAIHSNVLANGCYQFAVCSLQCLRNWQLSAATYLQMVSINLHIYLLVLAGGTINVRNILAKRCHQIAVCLLSCWQIGAINFQLSAVMCQQRVHTNCRGRLTRRVFLSRGKLGNLHSLISDVHRFAVYQLPCYRISCYLQLSASIY